MSRWIQPYLVTLVDLILDPKELTDATKQVSVAIILTVGERQQEQRKTGRQTKPDDKQVN